MWQLKTQWTSDVFCQAVNRRRAARDIAAMLKPNSSLHFRCNSTRNIVAKCSKEDDKKLKLDSRVAHVREFRLKIILLLNSTQELLNIGYTNPSLYDSTNRVFRSLRAMVIKKIKKGWLMIPFFLFSFQNVKWMDSLIWW